MKQDGVIRVILWQLCESVAFQFADGGCFCGYLLLNLLGM